MSMFYELMMRKKEEIMYATIKGTLTENDGVFSGFGGGNYLQIQNIINIGTKDFVIATKIKANSINNTRIIANYGTSYSGIHISSNKIAGSFYINGTRVQINNDITFTTNTDYYVVMYRKGTTIGISVSTDTVNWTTNEQTIQSTDEVNFGFNNLDIGVNRYGATFFDGSIDLNNSYIKLGSTKYKLQAVVGYTIVGNPTITDGVVSGFTTSDYIRINPFNNIGTQDFELATAFITNTSISMRIIATYGASGTYTGLAITNLGAIRFTVYNGVNQYIVTSSQTYQTGTKYYIKCYRKGTEVGIKVSTDNVNWITDTTVIPENTNLVSSSEFLDFGVNRYGGSALNGSIDLNNTYIKINNKLWFNGQQA